MNADQPMASTRRDAVFDAVVAFIGTLTGTTPPPFDQAPPEVSKPFRDLADKLCTIFEASPTGSYMDGPPAAMLKFTGTPTEIGSQIWDRMCLPAVGTAAAGLPPEQLLQLYSGFTASVWGAMAADFGPDMAVAFARQMLDGFEAFAPTLGDGASIQ